MENIAESTFRAYLYKDFGIVNGCIFYVGNLSGILTAYKPILYTLFECLIGHRQTIYCVG